MTYSNAIAATPQHLIQKYNVPGPRYTSYPTVPFWHQMPTEDDWKKLVKESFDYSVKEEGISIYIHLPFCSSLCTYCGCNTRITVNHGVELPYIKTLLAEWKLYLELFEEKPYIKEIHLGGGTPTFFSPENLGALLEQLTEHAILCEDASLGFEGHPKNTTKEHLQCLYDLGFRRLSLGIQDFNPDVQIVINRIQSFEMVEEVTKNAREIGYTSINYDLIFGLPLQTLQTIEDTIQKVNLLRPDRIAFYSYAHVPWLKPSQRMFTDDILPTDAAKRALYQLGKQRFEEMGYVEIGMDHFALPTDELYQAVKNKHLHRNFMGYSPNHTRLMIGLGASSISDAWTGFTQNVKKVEEYTALVHEGKFPFYRGHVLSEQDLVLRQHILNLMCQLETTWTKEDLASPFIQQALDKLVEMEKDGLIQLLSNQLLITEKGRPFVRNVCMALDEYLWEQKPTTQLFSQVI